MFIRPSYTLLAAMAVIAAPAFAQDAAEPAADAANGEITSPLATGADAVAAEAEKAKDSVTDAVNSAAESTGEAAKDAADAVKEAMPAEEAAPAAEGEAAPAADAAAAPEAKPAEEGAAPAEGAAASEEPKPGQYYAKSEHQDWTIRCIKADKGTDPCELYQLLKDGQGNSVAEVTMIPLSNGEVAAGATMVAPLETDLTKGLSLSIDGGEARGYPFSFCAPVGCVSRMGFTASELSALKRGSGAEVGLLPFGADPKNPVALKLSLSGFTAAFDELAKHAEESAPAEEEAPAE